MATLLPVDQIVVMFVDEDVMIGLGNVDGLYDERKAYVIYDCKNWEGFGDQSVEHCHVGVELNVRSLSERYKALATTLVNILEYSLVQLSQESLIKHGSNFLTSEEIITAERSLPEQIRMDGALRFATALADKSEKPETMPRYVRMSNYMYPKLYVLDVLQGIPECFRLLKADKMWQNVLSYLVRKKLPVAALFADMMQRNMRYDLALSVIRSLDGMWKKWGKVKYMDIYTMYLVLVMNKGPVGDLMWSFFLSHPANVTNLWQYALKHEIAGKALFFYALGDNTFLLESLSATFRMMFGPLGGKIHTENNMIHFELFGDAKKVFETNMMVKTIFGSFVQSEMQPDKEVTVSLYADMGAFMSLPAHVVYLLYGHVQVAKYNS